MANHKSAKKRIRRNLARAEINRARISRIRTFIKKVEAAVGVGDADGAKDALRLAQPEIMRELAKVSYTKRQHQEKYPDSPQVLKNFRLAPLKNSFPLK